MSNIEIYARFVGIGDSLFGFAQRAQYVGWFPVLSFNPVGMLHHESGGRRQNAMGAQTGPRKRVELGFSTMSAISPLQNAVDQGRSFTSVEIEYFRNDLVHPGRILNYRLEQASLSNCRLQANQWMLDVVYDSMRISDFDPGRVKGFNLEQAYSFN